MKFIKRTCWVLVIFMICFIFMNSLTPATSSKALSGGFTTMILSSLNQMHIQIDYELLHHIIRKLAHFSEYSVLGMMIVYAIHSKPLFHSKLINFSFFFLVPIVDELIQKFTPGRSCEIGDMLIDASGMIFGGLILFGLLHFLLDKRK